MSIKFYKTLSPYGEFSNFHRKVYKIHGIKYKSSEHYYQSKKFEGTDSAVKKAAEESSKALEMAQGLKLSIESVISFHHFNYFSLSFKCICVYRAPL